ncbi:uncharacterized protein [Littorina saxatilis]|uniref:uncharacterized protein n=1 Tax=Littorina saxatilis TaxID=31220 RepID=UPI0038B579F2
MAGGTRLASILLLSVFLFVRAQDDIREPPKILEPAAPRVEVYGLGVDVNLQCRASGQPTPLYEWYWNGARIESTNQAISYDSSTGVLTIKGLTEREEGFYNCRARNTFPNGMSAVVISPTIEVRRAYIERWRKGEDRTKIATERNYVFMTCGNTLPKYSGPINFKWSIGDSINIEEDGRVFIDSKGTLHFAYVLQTDEQSNKSYTCSLSNVVEEQLAPGRIRLVVQEPNSSDIAGVGQDRTASGYTATQPTDFPRRVARGLDPEDRCADGWENIHRGCYRFTVDPPLGWEDARMDCQGRGGELTSVSDMGEKRKLLKKMKALDKNRTWWVGLKRDNGTWNTWIDGGPFSYRVTRWKRGEPNNEGGKENCAEISSRGELNDKDCNSLRAFICEQLDIIERPTIVPSVKPRPTIVPSVKPRPTIVPSVKPRPTIVPSVKPRPTIVPSVKPRPTIVPSVKPRPTIVPSVKPRPTIVPSVKPRPTIEPSVKPRPTIVPSVKPRPTIVPSVKPRPTIVPSVKPRPTIEPSVKPRPTIVPSVKPRPTIVPSVKPRPTIVPSVKPRPTIVPSVKPRPTIVPSVKPRPTIVPSVKPRPTIVPSVKPRPTIVPSVKPTLQFSTKMAGQAALTFQRNEEGQLECFFSGYENKTGNEVPAIEWQDNAGNTIVNGTDRYTIESYGRVLKIASLVEADEKSYTCIGRNMMGTDEGRMVLNVTSPPIWVKPLEYTTAAQDQDAVFHCQARSAAGEVPPDPPRWFKNGQRLDVAYDPNKFVFTNEKRELRVKSAQDTDVGCFQCFVSNSEGEEIGNGCLTVISATTEFDLVESEKTSPLRNISMADINEETLPEIVNNTGALLRENTTTSAFDVILVANILENATRQRNIPIETATDILEIVEIVAGLNQTVLEQSNTADNATNRVLQAVESLGDSVSLGDSGSARIETNNTVLQVWNLTAVSDSYVLGLELALDSGEVTEIREGQGRGNRLEGELQHDNTDTAIMLPGKTFRSILENYPGRDIRVSGSVFTKTSLFRSSAPTVTDADSRHRHATLNSKVIALRITVDGQPKTNLSAFGDESVTTVFTPVQSLSKEQSFQRELSRCVFWDFALQDGKGAWSEEGCHHSDTVQEKVVCECDHLTNFAVLLDMYGQESRKEKIAQIHESALSLISVVGLSLSIAGLSVTVISFIVIKKLHSSNSQQTLFNMALALLLSWVTFLAGFSRVHGHVSCVLVAALLHYLILVSFMWMVIEGILVLLQFKARQGGISRYMLKTALPAWGLPLIPVIIILSIDVNLYNGGEYYCWMSRTPFYYAFLAPIAIMVSTNIVLYVRVVVSICRRRDISHGGTSYNVISIRASFASFVVLGLSWVFAFFAIEDARLVFQYLFTCTTAFQGILLFAIFTARDAAVRQFWLDLICRRKQVGRGSRGTLPPMQSATDRPVTKETSFNRSK